MYFRHVAKASVAGRHHQVYYKIINNASKHIMDSIHITFISFFIYLRYLPSILRIKHAYRILSYAVGIHAVTATSKIFLTSKVCALIHIQYRILLCLFVYNIIKSVYAFARYRE